MKILPALLVALLACSCSGSKDSEATHARCRANLRQIHMAMVAFQAKSKDKDYPRKAGEAFVVELARKGVLLELERLSCPGCDKEEGGPDLKGNPKNLTDYTAIDNRKSSTTAIKGFYKLNIPPSEIPVVWDKKGNHGGKRNVLFLGGNVETLTETEFSKLLKRFEKK